MSEIKIDVLKGKMMAEFVPLCKPGTLVELGIIKSLFDAEGILYYVNNEQYSSLGFAGMGFAGIGAMTMTIMVEKSFYDEAHTLLVEQVNYKF